MNREQTLEQLKKLKLEGMAARYASELSIPIHQQQDGHVLLALMAQAEAEHRDYKKNERYFRASKLRYDAIPESVECSAERGLTKEQFVGLLDGSYIRQHRNIMIHGATGCGKVTLPAHWAEMPVCWVSGLCILI